MKKTELKDVYCVPDTDDELKTLRKSNVYVFSESRCVAHRDAFDLSGILKKRIDSMREIPVSKFIDLLEDRIVPWRLEEANFGYMPTVLNKKRWILRIAEYSIILFDDMQPYLEVVYNELIPLNIKTFTELLQLLKFINYKMK